MSKMYKGLSLVAGAACISLAVCSGLGLLAFPLFSFAAAAFGISAAVTSAVGFGAMGLSFMCEAKTGSLEKLADKIVNGDKNKCKSPS